MKAITELVPRINISAMMGAAMMTERPMFFAWCARFARENGDVFESTQSAERHLAKDVETEERGRRKRELDRVIRRQLARSVCHKRERNERPISD